MECGTARIEITPPFAAALFGYPVKDRTFVPHKDKVLDPLQARALYIQNGSDPGILLITVDLCILLTKDALALRKSIAAEVSLPVEHILLLCTHTHSAPFARLVNGQGEADPSAGFVDDPEATAYRYGRWLLGRLLKIAAMAIARKSPASLSFRETFSGLGYDRRCRTRDGIRHCWNLRDFPERIPEPASHLRHGVLKFDYLNKSGGILLQNVGIHPVVMGKQNHQISGDWPCYARRHLERRLNGYQAIFTMGAGAQVQPWISTQSDPKALRWIGEAIGAEAVLMAATADTVAIPEASLRVELSRIPGTGVDITVVELGQLLLVLVPFELSANWAETVIRAVGRPLVFLCLGNGWDGYWMAPEEFAEGGYEVDVARSKGVGPGHAEALLERLRSRYGR
jgi:hypothetical protein